MIRLAAQPFNVNIIQIYLPTSSYGNEEAEEIYETVEEFLR